MWAGLDRCDYNRCQHERREPHVLCCRQVDARKLVPLPQVEQHQRDGLLERGAEPPARGGVDASKKQFELRDQAACVAALGVRLLVERNSFGDNAKLVEGVREVRAARGEG
jgi:hypothetical protein